MLPEWTTNSTMQVWTTNWKYCVQFGCSQTTHSWLWFFQKSCSFIPKKIPLLKKSRKLHPTKFTCWLKCSQFLVLVSILVCCLPSPKIVFLTHFVKMFSKQSLSLFFCPPTPLPSFLGSKLHIPWTISCGGGSGGGSRGWPGVTETSSLGLRTAGLYPIGGTGGRDVPRRIQTGSLSNWGCSGL